MPQGEEVGTGLLTYPVLMAADILLYQVRALALLLHCGSQRYSGTLVGPRASTGAAPLRLGLVIPSGSVCRIQDHHERWVSAEWQRQRKAAA